MREVETGHAGTMSYDILTAKSRGKRPFGRSLTIWNKEIDHEDVT
jgi:hypothetical protein